MGYYDDEGNWIEDDQDQQEGIQPPYEPDTRPVPPSGNEWGQQMPDQAMEGAAAPQFAVRDWGNEQDSYTNPPQQTYSPTSEQEFRRASAQPAGPALIATQKPTAPVGGPRIVGGYDQAGRPMDFGPGPGEGTRESPYRPFEQPMPRPPGMMGPTGRPLSPEERLAQTEARIAAATLSPAENILTARLQNGRTEVQTRMANGTLSPQAGMQAMQMIGQQLQPLMVRRQDLPMYLARARYQQMQMQTAQRAAIMQETARFNAMTAQQRVQRVWMPDGSSVSLLEDRNGHLTPLNDIASRQAAAREASAANQTQQNEHRSETAWRELLRHTEADIRREAATNLEELTPGQISEQALSRATRLWNARPPGTAPDKPGANAPTSRVIPATERIRQDGTTYSNPNAPAPGAPAPSGQQPAAAAREPVAPRPIRTEVDPANLPADQRLTLSNFQRLRQVGLARLGAGQERATFIRDFDAARTLYERYGDVRAMPPDAAQEFRRLVQLLDRAASPPQRQSDLPPPNFLADRPAWLPAWATPGSRDNPQ